MMLSHQIRYGHVVNHTADRLCHLLPDIGGLAEGLPGTGYWACTGY